MCLHVCMQPWLCAFVNDVLSGAASRPPNTFIYAFLRPDDDAVAATGSGPEAISAVSLLSCDPLRLLTLCRIVAQSYSQLEHSAYLIAAAVALKDCVDPTSPHAHSHAADSPCAHDTMQSVRPTLRKVCVCGNVTVYVCVRM